MVPAGSGEFGIALSTLTITSYFVLGGLDTIVVRTVAGDLAEHKTAAAHGVVVQVRRTLLIAAPAVALLLFVVRQPIAEQVLHEPSMTPILGVMLWATIPLTLQKVASAALRASGGIVLSQLIDGPVGTTFAALAFAVAIAGGWATTVALPAALYVIGLGGWRRGRLVVFSPRRARLAGAGAGGSPHRW